MTSARRARTTFATPITLTFKVPANQDASKLAVGLLEAQWAILTTTSAGGALATQTPHLSTYALVKTCQPPCATGESCMFDQSGTPGCGNLAVGGIDAGTAVDSGTDSGTGTSDCTTTCTTGCCDKNNVCHTDGATNLANCGQPGGACRACSGTNAQCLQGLCVASP